MKHSNQTHQGCTATHILDRNYKQNLSYANVIFFILPAVKVYQQMLILGFDIHTEFPLKNSPKC